MRDIVRPADRCRCAVPWKGPGSGVVSAIEHPHGNRSAANDSRPPDVAPEFDRQANSTPAAALRRVFSRPSVRASWLSRQAQPALLRCFASLIAFEKILKLFCESTILDTGHEYNRGDPGWSPARRPVRRGIALSQSGCDGNMRRLTCPLRWLLR